MVEGETPTDTATSRTLDADAIRAFPARSADELLRAVPGLHLSSHGGRGKSFQFLVRGFDAEHGADLAVSVAGVPINEPSNVHGQGYIDLHFLPTPLVLGLDLEKGSYRAKDGDFAVTGSAAYEVGLAREGVAVTTGAGTDRSGRGGVAWRPAGAPEGRFVVLEGEGAVGVGEGRRYDQLRAAVGEEVRLSDAVRFRALAFAYRGEFESPGVLRADDLALGEIGFYDAYPVHGGGASSRALATARVDLQGETFGEALVWAGGRTLALDQNFTGYLRDPVHGDGTRQSEVAASTGLRGELGRIVTVGDRPQAVRVGVDVRGDGNDQREDGVTVAGRAWDRRLDARVRQLDTAAWSELRLGAGPLSLVPGLRLERLAFAAEDRRALDLETDRWRPIPDPTWARADALVALPKASGVLEVADPLSLYASAGRGLRSPDARGIADGDRAPISTSSSAEAGARVSAPEDRVVLSGTGYRIVVGNELLFDHLAGRFLSAGRTRRLGIESVLDVRPLEGLHLQLDGSFTDARFTQDGTPIPYAPRVMVAAGVFAEDLRLGTGARLTGGVRAFALGRRPLPSGFASHPAAVGALTSRLDLDRLTVGLDVDNLFLGHWRDGEFVFPSWFDRSEPRSELKTLHVTPGDPFVVRLVLTIRPEFGRGA